jgi:hypothetical protein
MNHNTTLLHYALSSLGPDAIHALMPSGFALDGERIMLSGRDPITVWDGGLNPALPFAGKAVELFFRRVGAEVERFEMQWVRRAA